MRVGIVGAGPAGSHLARLLAQAGFGVRVFDASHPREKPCGGGLTSRALALLPVAPADDPLPARRVEACTLETASGDRVELRLERPVAIAARRELDAWLLRRAVGVGAVHVAERVTAVGDGWLQTTEREERNQDGDDGNATHRRTSNHKAEAGPSGQLTVSPQYLSSTYRIG